MATGRYGRRLCHVRPHPDRPVALCRDADILRTALRWLPQAIPVTVNGTPRALYGTWDQPLCVLGFTVAHGQIAELHLIADRAKLQHLRLSFPPGRTQRAR